MTNSTVYTTSTAQKIVYNSACASEYGTANRIVAFPNLKIALVTLRFDLSTISESGWYDLATLPVSTNIVQNFSVLSGVAGAPTNSHRMDIGLNGNLLRIYAWKNASGQRVYFDAVIAIS